MGFSLRCSEHLGILTLDTRTLLWLMALFNTVAIEERVLVNTVVFTMIQIGSGKPFDWPQCSQMASSRLSTYEPTLPLSFPPRVSMNLPSKKRDKVDRTSGDMCGIVCGTA